MTAKKKGPAVVRGKSGLKSKTAAARLKQAEGLLAMQKQQAANPLGAAVAAEAAAMQTAHDALAAAVAGKATINAAVADNLKTKVAAIVTLEQTVGDYIRGAGRAANGDPAALASLGVEQAALPNGASQGAPAAVTDVSVGAGVDSGDALIKYPRPAGAASFAIQYKPEPAGPNDVYQPAMGYQTKRVEYTIPGLLPAQQIRVRVMAIGDEAGPWSAEVIGRAR